MRWFPGMLQRSARPAYPKRASSWGEMTMTKVALTGAALLWAGLVAADDDCAFTAERTAEESADGIERLEIRAGAGDLNVEGENGLRSVYVTGSACARTEAQLDRVQLRLVREGSTLVLEALPEAQGFSLRSWFGRNPAKLDVTVRLPAGLAVGIEDSSGRTRVANVGAAEIADGSGDLQIENVRGALEVRDGAGQVSIRNVQGTVRIGDGSGDFSITKVVGDVIVLDDGSGSMEIVDVQGNVTIGRDGSGDILVERVTGSVRIEEDGSGSIRIASVQHDVIIDRDGTGSIFVDDVQGDFTVEISGSGDVQHQNVRGRVRIGGEAIAPDESDESTEADEANEELEGER